MGSFDVVGVEVYRVEEGIVLFPDKILVGDDVMYVPLAVGKPVGVEYGIDPVADIGDVVLGPISVVIEDIPSRERKREREGERCIFYKSDKGSKYTFY